MTPPQWILDYVKRELTRATEEGVKKAAEKVAAEGKPKKKKASKPTRDDRASEAQVTHTKQVLMDGDQKFTKVVLPTLGAAYFSQGDSRWEKTPFPKWKKNPDGKWEAVYEFKEINRKTGEETWKTRTLRAGGCGPTSLAIAIATLRPDAGLTPKDVGEFAIEKRYSGRVGSRGTSMSMVEPLTEKYGLASEKIEGKDPHKIDKLREGLDNHGVAVVHVKHGVFNYKKHPDEKKPDGGHFIAVIGYGVGPSPDNQEWFFVANPGKDASAKTMEDHGLIVDRSLGHHGAGMVRVSRQELEKLMQESYMVTDPNAEGNTP